MSYSILAVIFIATIALSSATVPIFDQERNVLVRFYSDFAQLYRAANLKSFVDQDQTIEQYQFYFPEREYIRIAEESLMMLSTNVIDRTVTFHSTPNFAVNGSRYFYRRDPKQESTVEIELVNPQDRLFREVNQPDRYFYLPAFADLEYSGQVPIMSYYEVIFTCNVSSPQKQTPLLSYIDRSLQYTPRYLLDLPSVLTNDKPMEMRAYADIRNTGEVPIVIKGAELVTGDISLNRRPFDFFRTVFNYEKLQRDTPTIIRPLGEQTSATVVYQLSLPTSVTIPARTLKSVRFLETRMMVESFFYYSSLFSPTNSKGKLLTAYNLTSLDNFLPNGRLLLREQGRFLGQIDLPDIPVNTTHTIIFGGDADVSYRRQVTVLSDEESDRLMSYYVEYIFENVKSSRDVPVYFSESFSAFRSFEMDELSRPRNNLNLLNIELRGTDLRGYFMLPRQADPVVINYKLLVEKDRRKFRLPL